MLSFDPLDCNGRVRAFPSPVLPTLHVFLICHMHFYFYRRKCYLVTIINFSALRKVVSINIHYCADANTVRCRASVLEGSSPLQLQCSEMPNCLSSISCPDYSLQFAQHLRGAPWCALRIPVSLCRSSLRGTPLELSVFLLNSLTPGLLLSLGAEPLFSAPLPLFTGPFAWNISSFLSDEEQNPAPRHA